MNSPAPFSEAFILTVNEEWSLSWLTTHLKSILKVKKAGNLDLDGKKNISRLRDSRSKHSLEKDCSKIMKQKPL